MVFDEADAESRRRVAAFEQGLEKLGWAGGRNLHIDYRWGIANAARARTAAAEVLSRAPPRSAMNSRRLMPSMASSKTDPVSV
jgi:hypothetical protein